MKKKFATRAVIIDDNNIVPILKVGNGEYYKIPGGTIEKGESIEEALKREMMEESGCMGEVVSKIGEYEFTNQENSKVYHSTCFLVKLKDKVGDPSFDEWERERGFELIWLDINKAIKLFENCNPSNSYEKIIHERDLNFLKKAKEMIFKD